jgi:hypothetical protein
MNKKLLVAISIPILLVAIVSFSVLPTFGRRRLTWPSFPRGFEHGLALDIGDGNGAVWYFKGAGTSPGVGSVPGVIDVPGHAWRQVGTYRVFGLHYNIGPDMGGGAVPQFWASGEPNGGLLFAVKAIIAPWSVETANKMARKGYVHYHELVLEDGTQNEDVVVWLKHIAVKNFVFDGGPPVPINIPHQVFRNRVDYLFMPNYFMPFP